MGSMNAAIAALSLCCYVTFRKMQQYSYLCSLKIKLVGSWVIVSLVFNTFKYTWIIYNLELMRRVFFAITISWHMYRLSLYLYYILIRRDIMLSHDLTKFVLVSFSVQISYLETSDIKYIWLCILNPIFF